MRKLIAILLGLNGAALFANMENASVLPKGVRNLTFKSGFVNLGSRTNSDGSVMSLAAPLQKELSFKDVLKRRDGVQKTLLRGFMLENGFVDTDIVGETAADMTGSVSVVAPVLSIGITDRWTFAVGLPVVSAQMRVKQGFVPSENGLRMVDTLHASHYNQTSAAREAAGVIAKLQETLENNGYQRLQDWQDSGVGDVVVANKLAVYADDNVKSAVTLGMTFPTGRFDDPDVLNDIPFGEQTWTSFAQVAVDEYVTPELFVNQYAKLTYVGSSDQTVRLKTPEEAIEVPKATVRVKRGNQFLAGTSVQWEPSYGLVSGIGYEFFLRGKDAYDAPEPSRGELEKDTFSRAHHLSYKLGYSTIPAFKKGAFPVPLKFALDYKQHLASANATKDAHDMVLAELMLFF